jgi:hypothetical protein
MRWWPFGSRTGDTPHGSSRASEERDERLSAYIDGDLTVDERSALDAELAANEALRDDLAGMRAVTAALGQLESVRAPRPFTLEAPPVSSRRPRILDVGLQLGAALSALLLVVAIVDPGDGGGIASTAVPIEQSRSAESSQTAEADSGNAAAGGALALPEASPVPANGGTGATGEEDGAGAGSSSGAATEPGEPATAPSESLQAAPPETSGGSEDVPAPADATRSDFDATDDAGNDDGATTAPPPANAGPDEGPSSGAAGDSSLPVPVEGDGGDAATSPLPQPVPGTEEGLAASDMGGDDENFVPALAVLTALLTALVALRWGQTRRTA